MYYEKCLKSSDSEEHKVWVLIEYASWRCEAEGNLAGTISGKLAAVQYFHRLEAGVELPTPAPCLRARSEALLEATLRQGPPPGASSGVLGDAVRGEGPHPLLGCRGKGDVALFVYELFPDCPVG